MMHFPVFSVQMRVVTELLHGMTSVHFQVLGVQRSLFQVDPWFLANSMNCKMGL